MESSDARPWSARRCWVVSFLLFAMLAGSWSLASPLFSAPDEPAHVINAAAVVRGQLLPPHDGGVSQVRVPAVYASAHAVPGCFAFKATVPADCAPGLTGPTSDVVVGTPAGRYPLLYYAVVGLPTLVAPPKLAVYLMRLISILLCAGFLAGALSAAASARRPRFLVLGVAVAVTPMVLFLAGAVNPNSLEIAAAVCLWVCGLVLVGRPPAAAVPGLVSGLGASACVLVLTRALSPVWLACIGAVLLLLAGWSQLVELWRRPDVRRCVVAIAATSVVAMLWIYYAGTNAVDTTTRRYPLAGPAGLRASLDRTDWSLHQMVGIFGWLDAPASPLAYYAWFFVIGLLLLLGLAAAGPRVRLALLSLSVATVLLPVALESRVAPYLGLVWQGRYTMPIAVGVPLLAGYALTELPQSSSAGHLPTPVDAFLPRLCGTVVATLVIAHVSAFLWALRRYTVGLGLTHKLDLFSGRWQPPLTAAGVSVLFAVAALGYGWWLLRLVRAHREPEPPPAPYRTTVLDRPLSARPLS